MKDKIWRVYRHITPDGMIYVGVTSQKLYNRWHPSKYRDKSLYPYIEKFGWDNIQHEVIYTCDDRNEALSIEDEMIQYWTEKGCCINKQRSGLIRVSDVKAYRKAWYNEHAEEMKAYSKSYHIEHREERKVQMRVYNKTYFSTPEGKIYYRVKAYNQHHPDSITITPLEARYNYTTYGVIPDFIKSDDIPVPVDTQGIYTSTIPIGDQIPLF